MPTHRIIGISTFRVTSELIAPGRFVGPVAVIILGLVTSAVVIRGTDSQLFLLFSLIFSIIVLANEKLGLALLFPLSFYSLYLRSVLSIPALFSNLIYIVVILLALRWFAPIILNRRALPRTSIDWTIGILFVFISLSIILNRPPLGAALKSLILHNCFILLFYVLAHSNIREPVLKKLPYALLVVALIQVLASFIQYFFLSVHLDPGGRHDSSGGLFGSSSGTVNAVFMVYTFSVIIGFIKVYGAKFLHIFLIFLLIIPIVLSSAQAGFIFFVLTGLFVLGITPLLQGRLLKRDVAQLQGLMIFLMFVIFITAGQTLRLITSPQAMIERSTSHGKRLGRLDQINFAHAQISRNAKTLIFGLGPGQVTHTRQGAIGGETSSEFYKEYGDEISTRQSYMYITLELGYGGLILFLYLHYKLIIFSTRIFKGVDDKFWKAIALGFCGVIFTSAYSIVYTQTWIKPPILFPFWLMAGSLYRVGRIKGIFRE